MPTRKSFIFQIDALRPETLSMKSLAKYLEDIAALLGEESEVHFDRVQEGSAELVWWAEEEALPQVTTRLNNVYDFADHKEFRDAVLNLNKRLASDDASAVMLDENREVLADFPGKAFEAVRIVPAFWQEDQLQGRLIRIGGKDETIHAQLDMGGKIVTNISLDTELAREIVKFFLGPTLRLFGKAKWRRDYLGQWKLLAFSVHSFEVLDDIGLEKAIDQIGSYLREGIREAAKPYSLDDEDDA